MRRAVRLVARHARVAMRTLGEAIFGVASPAGRDRVKRIAGVLGMTEGVVPTLPTVGPDELTSDGTPISLFGLEPRDGNVSLLEVTVLSRLVREHAPMAIFEIGTFDGRTTLNLAANAPDDAVVYTLDLPANKPTAYALAPADYHFVNKPASGARLAGTPYAARVTQLYGDSATFDFSPYRAEFVFVDGSHAYEYVMSDSMRALELVGSGPGVIVWHDYAGWDGVTRALHELAATDPRFASLRWIRGTSLVLLVVGRGTRV
ncbi:MAG: class I SAM-dependent methyltransferase [Gemmatimonadaceae bacterium]|nr:class I SAM-dependent methyltransferase [Gemmatimonadaceae bacterium]